MGSGQSCVKLRQAGRVKVIRPRILSDENEKKSKDRGRETPHRSRYWRSFEPQLGLSTSAGGVKG